MWGRIREIRRATPFEVVDHTSTVAEYGNATGRLAVPTTDRRPVFGDGDGHRTDLDAGSSLGISPRMNPLPALCTTERTLRLSIGNKHTVNRVFTSA